MDIAALSMVMKQTEVAQQKDIAMLKKVMDISEINIDEMVKMLEQSVTPHLGQNIDISI